MFIIVAACDAMSSVGSGLKFSVKGQAWLANIAPMKLGCSWDDRL
jgi:hypothetical protein